jgi:hypothetical protein
MVMTCKEVLVLFSIEGIQFVRTLSLTLEAVREMICNDRSINDLQIHFKINVFRVMKYINVWPSYCSFTRHTRGKKNG